MRIKFKTAFLAVSVLIVAVAVFQSVDALTQSYIKQEQSSALAQERDVAYYAI